MYGETLDYPAEDRELEGWLAYDDGRAGPRPGVLIIHQWMGVSDHERAVASDLAEAGYVALCADVYGKGDRPRDVQQAVEYATAYRSGDRALLRARLAAGLDALRAQDVCDPSRVGAIGYCFGGTAALELARSGAPLRGVASLHGGLNTPNAADAANIHGKVLALHGADDPVVPPEDVAAFQDEMRNAGVDWQLHSYGGAVHSFTIEGAGNDPSSGSAYDERAHKRSWRLLMDFLRETV